jgi:hypothetical protein
MLPDSINYHPSYRTEMDPLGPVDIGDVIASARLKEEIGAMVQAKVRRCRSKRSASQQTQGRGTTDITHDRARRA